MPEDASSQSNPPERRDLSGRTLGDYRLLRRLGRGAMAEVYLAEQLSLERQIALKVLKADLANDATYVQRFQREARAAASLAHANIVQIYEVGQVDGLYYIAQEYVDGPNLQQWLARHGTLDLPTALLLLWQAASALSKAAENKIVHRDIKPENILLAASGEVKVADFGLARVTQGQEGLDLTQVGMTLGTPLYMSPEQVEGQPLDARSDIYSLGVTFYHMLAGEPPFQGDTALGVAVQHLKRDPKPLEAIRPDLPPALARLIHRMLAKSPNDRFESPRLLLREIRELQRKHVGEEWPEHIQDLNLSQEALLDAASAPATSRLASLMKTEALVALKRSRKRRIVMVLGPIAALLIGGATAYLTWARETPLLSEAETATKPASGDTVHEQWIQAARVGSEEAWLAVVRHEDATPYIANYARRQLTKLYMIKRRDFASARAELDRMIEADDSAETRAFRLTALAYMALKEKDFETARKHLAELDGLTRDAGGVRQDPLANDPTMQNLRRDCQELLPAANAP